MFHTVRHWWGSGRGKLTARLFLFELIVVIAGVLIAQALAAYVKERSDLARMHSERARIRYELRTTHSAFQVWQVGAPCLDRRMTEIMMGTAFAPGALRRPALQRPGLSYVPPTTESLELLTEHYGVKEKNRLDWVAQNIDSSSTVIASIITTWGRLALIDPANGAVTPADRVEARLAAADIKAQLRAMEVLSRDANRTLTEMGIVARNPNEPTFGPAQTCAAIWNSGRLDPPLGMR